MEMKLTELWTNIFAKVLENGLEDWYTNLQLFLITYRAALHETTEFIYETNKKVSIKRLPCDIEFGSPPIHAWDVTDYAKVVRKHLTEIHDIVID